MSKYDIESTARWGGSERAFPSDQPGGEMGMAGQDALHLTSRWLVALKRLYLQNHVPKY